MDDPELKGKSVTGDDEVAYNPYTTGLYVVGIVDEEIESLGIFMEDIYKKMCEKGMRTQITRNALTMMKGAIFAIGTNKLNNPEWKEHCASSLREIYHEWKNQDFTHCFQSFFRGENLPLTEEEKNILKTFYHHYDYFSGIDHHEVGKYVGALKAISGDHELKPDHCYKDDIFIERVKDFFLLLKKIASLSKQEQKNNGPN